MGGFVDPDGLGQSRGIEAAERLYGFPFALEIVNCHRRYLAGDHERVDSFGRSYYVTSFCTIVFCLPTAPPWFVQVYLPQEL